MDTKPNEMFDAFIELETANDGKKHKKAHRARIIDQSISLSRIAEIKYAPTLEFNMKKTYSFSPGPFPPSRTNVDKNEFQELFPIMRYAVQTLSQNVHSVVMAGGFLPY